MSCYNELNELYLEKATNSPTVVGEAKWDEFKKRMNEAAAQVRQQPRNVGIADTGMANNNSNNVINNFEQPAQNTNNILPKEKSSFADKVMGWIGSKKTNQIADDERERVQNDRLIARINKDYERKMNRAKKQQSGVSGSDGGTNTSQPVSTQQQQAMQELDNQRIEKEYRLQQAKKNPSFRSDVPDPSTQNQSFWSAVKGNTPQGGDRNQVINEKTSVFANPNNQSSMGGRMLSWAKNNPRQAILGSAATAAGLGAAAYGIHKMRQLKKKQNEQAQQTQYNQPMYHTASEHLTAVYTEKLAASEVEDIATSIPQGVQDDASMIEKIQEAVKYTKKEDVPGGKSAPSKLVQRKNKERFKK